MFTGEDAINSFKKAANDDLGLMGLKAAIIVVALIFIVAALVVNNKVALGAMLAYIMLP
jgi:hypothetical protein